MQNVVRTEDGYMLEIAVNKMFTTCGDGYWSRTVKEVFVESITMFISAELQTYSDGTVSDYYGDGDLAVNYDEDTWNDDELGLIYTDSKFLECVRTELIKAGISVEAAEDVTYSEQGMQDYGRVSCDAYELAHYVRARMGVTAQA